MDSTKLLELSPVVLQPGTRPSGFQTGTEQCPVCIRNMEAQDVEFVARVVAEGFFYSLEHVVGKSRVEDFILLNISWLSRSAHLWNTIYVALYEGRLAGAVMIKFQGDKLVSSTTVSFTRFQNILFSFLL
ncbi:uncharacterized protein LOC118422665 [Branchiostoma floridae]|uniref:Uncharacterized protein LOC118422665 n=1 Tax=Branchiostoma floridae TaxID=7739 RepID=A0A9J7LNL0_BRAFL|nr:uncharacterized protein LOC118422665 [Branchiostoma floridae]XP_035686231.1 uncharacterized protein LOC118422665 [Branchiostoma floridae]